jgi:hypothetical protein
MKVCGELYLDHYTYGTHRTEEWLVGEGSTGEEKTLFRC